MSSKKVTIVAIGPILPGNISTAYAKCGKPTCRTITPLMRRWNMR